MLGEICSNDRLVQALNLSLLHLSVIAEKIAAMATDILNSRQYSVLAVSFLIYNAIAQLIHVLQERLNNLITILLIRK